MCAGRALTEHCARSGKTNAEWRLGVLEDPVRRTLKSGQGAPLNGEPALGCCRRANIWFLLAIRGRYLYGHFLVLEQLLYSELKMVLALAERATAH